MTTTEDYRAEEQLLRRPARPGELVIGDRVRPQWLEGGARFWYAVNTGAGKRFVLADPAAGTREPAFDHARPAAALTGATQQQVDPDALPFMAIVAWSPDSTKVLTHQTDQRAVRQTHLVEARPAEHLPTAELVVLDVAEGTVVRARTGTSSTRRPLWTLRWSRRSATGPGGYWSNWSAPTSPGSPPPARRRRNGSGSRRPTA